ncbi:MAG: putative PEP-binding protein [Geminicoccaceae bacterium]
MSTTWMPCRTISCALATASGCCAPSSCSSAERSGRTRRRGYRAYARLLQRLGGRPLILRTLDIGGDKPLPDLDIPAETNPSACGHDSGSPTGRSLRPQVRQRFGRRRMACSRSCCRWSAAPPRSSAVLHRRGARPGPSRAAGRHHGGDPGSRPRPRHHARRFRLDRLERPDAVRMGWPRATLAAASPSRSTPLDPAVLRLIRMVVEMAAAKGLLPSPGDMASDRAGIEALVAIGIERVSVAPAALGRVKLWIAGCAGRAHGLPRAEHPSAPGRDRCCASGLLEHWGPHPRPRSRPRAVLHRGIRVPRSSGS